MSREFPTRRRFLQSAGVASTILIAGCSDNEDGADDGDDENGENSDTSDGSSDTSDGSSSTSLEDEYPNAWAIDEELGIVVLSADAVVERFGSTITGEVVNASGEDYDYVQLSFDLLDDRDTKYASALANTSGLRAGQRWRYEAVGGSSPEITTFRLVEVTAY
jgi:hypothetical protein